MRVMQGDAYLLGVQILNNAQQPVTPADVADVEITIGHRKKKYTAAELIFQDGLWLYPLTQRETLDAQPVPRKAQVRVKWANGAVEGKPLYGVRIDEGISREVL